jgi:hypothetical protein
VEVRNRLAALEHRFITYDRYQALCESVGMEGGEHQSLVQFLHQVGAVFYQPGSFGDRIILDQKWAIEAVYAIFDRRGAAYSDLKRTGTQGLTLDLLRQKVWRHFSADEHQILLEFMRSCELCFEFSRDIYYVPQLLPEAKPPRVALRWRQPTTYSMKFTYAFLHRAIIERFIVRVGRLGADVDPEIWKDGIVIYDDKTDTEALIEALAGEKCIRIQARGHAPLDMLHMIRKEFDELHQDFPAQLAFSADAGVHFVAAADLQAYAAANASMVPAVGGGLVGLDAYTVFLGDISRRLPKGELKKSPPLVEAPEQEEIFISYAWGNPRGEAENREAIVDRLCDTLEMQHYKIIRDKKDNGYRKVISSFMQRLGKGKLVIVVISDKYLKSPYCMYELLEIYTQGGFYERIFPIVLPDAQFYDLADRLRYIKYWTDKKKEIEDLITEIGLAAFSADAAFQEYDLYYRRVFNNVDKLTRLLADWNALTPELLEENNFGKILLAIDTRLQELAPKD